MLRKENKEFLEVFWKKYPDREERRIQDSFKKRNPSQIIKRIVTHANTSIDDLIFILANLPEKHREKIEIERGFGLFKNRISTADDGAKLRLAKEHSDEAIRIIETVIKKDKLLDTIYKPKLDEFSNLIKLLVLSKTRLKERSPRTISKSFDDSTLGELINKQKRTKWTD